MTLFHNMPKKEYIRKMFDSIAGDYDMLNHIMSLDVDKRWRRKAIKAILADGRAHDVLDLACGTGDFSIALAKAMGDGGGKVTGVDLSEGMLEVMRKKVDAEGLGDMISMSVGDGESLPFEDRKFSDVSIAFGIRNFEDRPAGLREMLRVLSSGGKLVILELSMPEFPPVRWLYKLYFLHVLPWIGGLISGDKGAYRYLPASVVGFPDHRTFMATMRECGFRNVTHKAFTFGICRMYIGEK